MSTPSSSELRLVKLPSHRAFSSVWLGEDLGRVPLTQLSKRDERDLRRRASGRRKRNSDTLSEDDTVSLPEKDDDGVATKHSSGRLSEGDMLSLSKFNPSWTPPSSHNLDCHPSHSPSVFIEEVALGISLDIPPSPFSSNLTLPSSPLNLNFLAIHSDGQASTPKRDLSSRKFRERVEGTRPAFCLGRVYLDERDEG